MDFLRTSLIDAYVVKSVIKNDERGFFARVRCSEEFAAHGLPSTFVQASFSHNVAAATFRGLHYQIPPSQEGKLVRCIIGAIDDVIVDLRPDSPTFLKHEWFQLTADEISALYVPPG
ncbi:MAG: dTDP-4-dehydrorhamnose 3,5-epimerase family protein, partial [Gammaproteobacteria bacterium]|nr:dTDP-4-dehydrorhamnose 3,5-epimerase family protein [Gammaproteobacteria bacterium]